MHRRLLSAAATSALLLGLAACGEPTDGPVTTPPPSISVSGPSDGGGDTEPSDGGGETVEPTAEAPSIPPPDPADFAGMDEHTAEGAEQAARYYVALTIWGYQTGETAELESTFSDSCSVCLENLNNIDSLKESGEFWSPVTLEDSGLSSEPDGEDFEIIVSYATTLSAHREPDPGSGETIDIDPITHTYGVGLDWTGSEWIVRDIYVEFYEA